MEYLRGLRVMREDESWTGKIGVACLLMLSSMVIPILGQVAFQGWRALVVRRAVAGVDTPLPRLDLNFDYLGKLLGPGFKSFIARMVWSFPAAMIMVVLMFCVYFGIGVAAVGGAAATSDHGGSGGLIAACCMSSGMLLVIPLGILLQLPAMVAGLRAEISDDLQAAFDVRAVFDMTRAMIRELLTGQLVLALLSIPMVLIGILTCGLGIFPVAVVMSTVHAYFTADIYKLWLTRGGAPLTVGPMDLEPPHAPASF